MTSDKGLSEQANCRGIGPVMTHDNECKRAPAGAKSYDAGGKNLLRSVFQEPTCILQPKLATNQMERQNLPTKIRLTRKLIISLNKCINAGIT